MADSRSPVLVVVVLFLAPALAEQAPHSSTSPPGQLRFSLALVLADHAPRPPLPPPAPPPAPPPPAPPLPPARRCPHRRRCADARSPDRHPMAGMRRRPERPTPPARPRRRQAQPACPAAAWSARRASLPVDLGHEPTPIVVAPQSFARPPPRSELDAKRDPAAPLRHRARLLDQALDL
jgi:hypothetical protein